MVHAGASTSCHLLSALLVHPKYLLMTAYNEIVKLPPSVVLPRRLATLMRKLPVAIRLLQLIMLPKL